MYLYTAIYAPKNFGTTVVHHWQYFDAEKGRWMSRDRLRFSITGSTSRGYRGYSVKSSVQPGKWRVDVETVRGQVLGRVNFSVAATEEPMEFETIVK